MAVLRVYLRIYAASFAEAVRGIARSPWTLLLPIALFGALLVGGMLLSSLGMVGGILLALLINALLASYLYVTSEIVDRAKVRLDELSRSIGPFFWSVMNLMFVIWVVELLLGLALVKNERAAVIFVLVRFAAFVLMNACPEVIYRRHTYGGIATIQRSVEFIHHAWIEWFIPNLAFGAAFYFGVPALLGLGVPTVVVAILAGAVLHLVMVFRGHLFSELDGSSHRQRMFKYRLERD